MIIVPEGRSNGAEFSEDGRIDDFSEGLNGRIRTSHSKVGHARF